MSVRDLLSKFEGLMALVSERSARISSLEILMPIISEKCWENIGRLENYFQVIVTFPAEMIGEAYLLHATREAEKVATHLFGRADRFLGSLQVRVHIRGLINVIETVRPLAAREMRESFRDFEDTLLWADQAEPGEVDKIFIRMVKVITRVHQEVLDEQIAQVTKPAPKPKLVSRKGRSAKSAADAKKRAEMKGHNPPAEKHGFNPEKNAKRARKVAQVKGKKRRASA